ncbi:DUF4349 domain-containing protein [Microbacterium stercoris]|nr:DUF4349 domain-containing protein [Microbacterium stercoris]
MKQDDGLPEVSDETLGRIEARVFEAIREDRPARAAAPRRRRRLWQGIGIAAAIVAVAAVISPAVLGGLNGGTATSSSDAGGAAAPEMAPLPEGAKGLSSEDGAVTDAPAGQTVDGDASAGQTTVAPDEREIIRTGSASILVDDPESAAREVADLAVDHGGWVEQLSIGMDRSYAPAETDSTVWVPEDGGFVSLRIPADDLDAVMTSLEDIGEVESSRVGTQDVTSTAVDLRARIDAARASVERLTTLMSQAGSVGDLVQVETALAQRQAELESLEQQLESLEGQVAMSTLSVSLLTEAPPVKADPAGFGDGLLAGWNGLLATLNGIVIGLGFVLPWLGVAAVILALIVVIRKGLRRKKSDS